MSDPRIAFAVTIATTADTGEVISAYFRIRQGRCAETCEFADGKAFADYDKNGYLLGIELLGPCRATIVDQLACNEPATLRSQAKEFLRKSGPRQLVAA